MSIRVVLAEDHTIVREGIRALLARASTVEVVGEAADGREAVATCASLRPDVLLLDLSMPVLDGIAAIPSVRAASPDTRVLVLSMHGGAEHVEPSLRAGARGYIVKGAGLSALVRAIERVAAGEVYLDENASRGADTGVTPREREVLRLVAGGMSSGEIATALSLSVKTVETHRANLMQKLDVPNVAALVDKAHRLRLVD